MFNVNHNAVDNKHNTQKIKQQRLFPKLKSYISPDVTSSDYFTKFSNVIS